MFPRGALAVRGTAQVHEQIVDDALDRVLERLAPELRQVARIERAARDLNLGAVAEERLHAAKLTTNRNTVPFDERPPTVASGVRIGTPAATMRGFDEDDFREVGRIIVDALSDGADVEALGARSVALCDKRPLYPGFRGYTTYAT